MTIGDAIVSLLNEEDTTTKGAAALFRSLTSKLPIYADSTIQRRRVSWTIGESMVASKGALGMCCKSDSVVCGVMLSTALVMTSTQLYIAEHIFRLLLAVT